MHFTITASPRIHKDVTVGKNSVPPDPAGGQKEQEKKETVQTRVTFTGTW